MAVVASTPMKSVVQLGVLVALTSVPLGAQTMVAPLVGATFGGNVVDPPGVVYGVVGGYWDEGPIGFEIDVGWEPEFLFRRDVSMDEQIRGDLTTLGLSLVFGPRANTPEGSRLRPYAAAGPVLLRLRVQEPEGFSCTDASTVGFAIGAGLLTRFSDRIGVRSDLRYIRDPGRNVSGEGPCQGSSAVTFSGVEMFRGTVALAVRF